MRRFTFFLVAFATTAGSVALIGPVPGHADSVANEVHKLRERVQ